MKKPSSKDMAGQSANADGTEVVMISQFTNLELFRFANIFIARFVTLHLR